MLCYVYANKPCCLNARFYGISTKKENLTWCMYRFDPKWYMLIFLQGHRAYRGENTVVKIFSNFTSHSSWCLPKLWKIGTPQKGGTAYNTQDVIKVVLKKIYIRIVNYNMNNIKREFYNKTWISYISIVRSLITKKKKKK